MGAAKQAEWTDPVVVDWCAFSLLWEERRIPWLVKGVGTWLRGFACGRYSDQGMHGYEKSVDLIVQVELDAIRVGRVAYGGEAQRGRAWVELEGSACGLVINWSEVRRAMELWQQDGRRVRLTRVDLAYDDMEGVHDILFAERCVIDGRFDGTGHRRPSTRNEGDWIRHLGAGRTLYVGARSSGKMLRVYEKGKQLGDAVSPWVRWEVQWTQKGRDLPFQMLDHRLVYFAGAYEPLEEVAGIGGIAVRTKSEGAKKTIEKVLGNARMQAGRAVNLAMKVAGGNASEAVRLLVREGLPRSLDKGSYSAAASVPTEWDATCEGVRHAVKRKSHGSRG